MSTYAYCTGCHSEVRTYVPKGKEELHYMRHYLDPLAPVGDRDRCLMGGEPVVVREEEHDVTNCTHLHEMTEEFLAQATDGSDNYMKSPPGMQPAPDPMTQAQQAVQAIAETSQSIVQSLAKVSRAMNPPPMNRAQRRAQRFGVGRYAQMGHRHGRR